MERGALVRMDAMSKQLKSVDPELLRGLRTVVSAAIEYGLVAVECGDERIPSIPTTLLTQAHRAASHGVSVDTVLRHCLAGHALLGDVLLREAERIELPRGTLRDLMRSQAALFDRLLAAVGKEYMREQQHLFYSSDARLAARVRRLLAGDLLDTSGFSYNFDAHHLAGIAEGPGAPEAVRGLAKALESHLLVVNPGDDVVWAWFGVRPSTDPEQLNLTIASSWPAHLPLSLGEVGEGLKGWRLAHEQAKAAFPIAICDSGRAIRYADVALLASMIQDSLLATSLREIFLNPLASGRGDGSVLRETLRAYFATSRNGASAAATLGVSRQTVSNRLRVIEERIGRPLSGCAGEIEAALRLEEVGRISEPALAHGPQLA